MNLKKLNVIIFYGILTITPITLNAQNLKKHKWKNRLVLIISETVGKTQLSEQRKVLELTQKELEERKIVMYQILPDMYRLNTRSSDHAWTYSKKGYKIYNPEKSAFKVILVGLDGEIKLEKHSLLESLELFETIDAMPMRQSEFRNKN